MSGAGRAEATGSGVAEAATTVTVDDSLQGSGQGRFDYHGPGWGHASGEGAPANPYEGTNSWSDHTGDSVEFGFTGTRLTFHGVTTPDMASARSPSTAAPPPTWRRAHRGSMG
ncbi:hypothetical protein ACFY0F_25850 [Streptomyces sp. NPDC001544]|uniref:hypothetical protein n=1 Tax=Streptomyces sp. NPDC001544 TaxID=3364584 RepID=UPI0036957BC4